MSFDLLENTPVKIDGKSHFVRFENGMTGIGSRAFWVDDKSYSYRAVRQSGDLTKGNHHLYLIKWRNQPWDKVYIFIHHKFEKQLLSEEESWREPRKVEL